MRTHYADLIVNQEEPEDFPNEVAYRLSALLGYDHYLVHRALEQVNPELIATEQDWYLSEDDLPAVASAISTLLLPEGVVDFSKILR
jgi:hypothetical protein